MSLRYILGDVGCGKTNFCIDEIIKKDNHKNTLIYIVPEQFSMESEKALLKRKEDGSIINTGVYSFKHLAFYIMDKLGVNNTSMLNDIGKIMLLKKTLLDTQPTLELYKKSINQKGFLDSLNSTISELMQYDVSVENLRYAIDSLDESNLKYKLKDINRIFDCYTKIIQDKYISAENSLDVLYNIIDQSDMIKNAEIWIDEFKSFTPQEYKIISKLLQYSKRVNITLTVNTKDMDLGYISLNDAYFETKNTLKKLNQISIDNKIKVDETVILNSQQRYRNDAMLHLANNYLKVLPDKYNNDTNHIRIHNASNKYDEIDMVCHEINRLVKHKNYKYEDIAIIISSKDYEKPLCNKLNKYNINNFIDTRRDITSHPITKTIVSAISVISKNWQKDSIFTLLKAGYIPIDETDIYLLENYVISQNIKGTQWMRDWQYGFDSKMYDKVLIDDIKDIFLDYMIPLTNNLKNSRKYTVKYISTVVFDFLKNINLLDTLNKNIENYSIQNNIEASMIDKQIWGLICDVFDKMVEFLGDEKVTVKEYLNILNSGLETATIGVIPAMSDNLIVGDIERTKLPEIKALFILGANEGILPPQRVEAGIFSDLERITLKTNYFEFAPDLESRLAQDKFNIYLAITKPTEYLYLSYCNSNINGSQLVKSSVITKIMDIFPYLKDKDYNPYDDIISSPLPTLDKLIYKLKNDDELTAKSKDLYNYYYNNKKYNNKTKIINSIINVQNDLLSIDIAKNLFGNSIDISVSRLESYAKCPYSFFLNYCLDAHEREEFKFENLESGNIYHAALEYSFSNTQNIEDMDNDDIENLADAAIDAAVIQTKKQSLLSVPRYEGYINRMKRTMFNILFSYKCKSGFDQFKPKEFELLFGSKNGIEPITFNLENGQTLNLTGKIDRIDHLKSGNKVYVKIIDYKQSEHKLDLNEVYNGIDIQLPLYMSTYIDILNKHKNIDAKPGGILYYHIHNPLLSKYNDCTVDKILDSLRLRGIIFDQKEVLASIKPQVISPVVFNEEKFYKLGKFINKKVLEIGNEMSKGNIQAKPYKYINKSTISYGCSYCKYKNICKIDLKDNANKYNIFKNDKNIFDKIISETSDNK